MCWESVSLLLSSVERAREGGDQWGGRAASTRSDNPARTEPESAGAPQPTPTRPNPKEGRREEAKGKLQRQQPFSVQLRSLQRSATLAAPTPITPISSAFSTAKRGSTRGKEVCLEAWEPRGRSVHPLGLGGLRFGCEINLLSYTPVQPTFGFRRAAEAVIGRDTHRERERRRDSPSESHSSLALYPPNQTISALLATS